MKNLFEIFGQPEVNPIQNHLMVNAVAVVVVTVVNHMVVDMGAHMEMIMVLNLAIVPNLQMAMGRVDIIHIIIITMAMMIGTVINHYYHYRTGPLMIAITFMIGTKYDCNGDQNKDLI